MHFGLLVLAGLLLAVSNTYEISQRSGRIRAAHDEGIRHLIENEGVQYRFALPDMTGSDEREEPKRRGTTMPKFVEVPRDEYNDFKRSVQAFTKLLKPESISALKRLTSAIVNGSRGEADLQSYGHPADKLTPLEQSPSSVRPSWPDHNERSNSNTSWVEQFPSVFQAAALQQPVPLQQQQEQQLLQRLLHQQQLAGIPHAVTVPSPLPAYMQSTPTAQEISFRQFATEAYPPAPYIQPAAPATFAAETPLEFTNPLQLGAFE